MYVMYKYALQNGLKSIKINTLAERTYWMF